MSFKKKRRARRAAETRLSKHRELLEKSVQKHLLPALIKAGFEAAPFVENAGPVDRKYSGSFPSWGRFIRIRDRLVDLVEIQFSSYGRAAFRINAGVAPREGLMTIAGHRPVEEVCVHRLGESLETHARPWLRPGLRALGLEPLGAWFCLSFWWFRPAVQASYDKLALRVAGLLPELELALREGNLGPHMRRMVMKPLPPEIIERLKKLSAEAKREE